MSSISIDQLAQAISDSLTEFTEDVVKDIDISSERVSKEAVATLKATSPKDTGKYAKAWRRTTHKKIGQPDTRIIYVAAPHYRLTHLLEKGHAKVGGGRVQAIPHIRPVEKEVEEQFTREVTEAIKNG